MESRLKMAVSGLVYKYNEIMPQVYLSTDNGCGGAYGDALTKDYGYVASSIVMSDVNGVVELCDTTAQIKIRGNSTAGAPKKPYTFQWVNRIFFKIN